MKGKRKQRKKRIREYGQTRFHIVPKSRGGADSIENVSIVEWEKHQLYHKLFGLKNPEEVIKELVNNYWNNRWSFVRNALN